MTEAKDTSHRKPFYGDTTVAHGGLTFEVEFGDDTDTDAPWDNGDGNGIVSDWTSRKKRPGERILGRAGSCTHRYFDWAGTVKKARAEGWNTEPYDLVETAGERAVRATQANFEYLQAWMADEWRYVYITVTCVQTGESDTCGGIETYKDYDDEYAWDMVEQLAEAQIKSMVAASEEEAKQAEQRKHDLAQLQSIADEFWNNAHVMYDANRYTDGMIDIARARFNLLCEAAGVQVK